MFCRSSETDIYQYTPIVSYEIKNDSIIYQKFIDDGLTERNAIAVHYDNNKTSDENAAKQFAQENIVHQKFYLGTDKFGRDILSRLIIGTRVSL
ncbi:MAG: ABC transporter permease, partial [Chitinophagaceae bacterium]|nr:ABC transporter permease [Chitinophagaceae bacterium]